MKMTWENFIIRDNFGPAIFISMFRYSIEKLAFDEDIISEYWWIIIMAMYVTFVLYSR